MEKACGALPVFLWQCGKATDAESVFEYDKYRPNVKVKEDGYVQPFAGGASQKSKQSDRGCLHQNDPTKPGIISTLRHHILYLIKV